MIQKKSPELAEEFDYEDDLDIQTFLNETVVERDIIRLPRPPYQGMLAAGLTTDTDRLETVDIMRVISNI